MEINIEFICSEHIKECHELTQINILPITEGTSMTYQFNIPQELVEKSIQDLIDKISKVELNIENIQISDNDELVKKWSIYELENEESDNEELDDSSDDMEDIRSWLKKYRENNKGIVEDSSDTSGDEFKDSELMTIFNTEMSVRGYTKCDSDSESDISIHSNNKVLSLQSQSPQSLHTFPPSPSPPESIIFQYDDNFLEQDVCLIDDDDDDDSNDEEYDEIKKMLKKICKKLKKKSTDDERDKIKEHIKYLKKINKIKNKSTKK